jgi:hypothetical protein
MTADTREQRDFASEIKFLVDPATGARIRDWARAHLERDPYGLGPDGDQYLTSTLYFDTSTFDVCRRTGSYGRAKYRVRRYDGEAEVFVERKLRREALLCKRRTLVPLDELARIADPAGWAGAWFARRIAVRQLAPVCQISYQRTARVAAHDTGRIRLTLDESIRAVPRQALSFAAPTGTPLAPASVVLELKYHVAMPALFKQLVEEFRLQPRRVSKYRLAAEALGFAATYA